MTHLESLIAEFYNWQGYLVTTGFAILTASTLGESLSTP